MKYVVNFQSKDKFIEHSVPCNEENVEEIIAFHKAHGNIYSVARIELYEDEFKKYC